MKTSKTPFFRFNQTYAGSRDSGSVKFIFFPGELSKKPIKYWANVGHIPPNSKLQKRLMGIKRQLDINWANTSTYLAYYSGARLECPFHVHWMGDSFEFELFNTFGEGGNRLYFTRHISSQNERFTEDEIKAIEAFLSDEYHRVWDSYRMTQEFLMDAKGYSSIRSILNRIASKARQCKND